MKQLPITMKCRSNKNYCPLYNSVIHLSLIIKSQPMNALVKRNKQTARYTWMSKMSCSFYSEDSSCGPAPGQDDIMIIPVKACDNDLSDDFFALGITGSTEAVQNAKIYSEADVLFNRGGYIFPTEKQIEEFTVCPRHRYYLTYGWTGRKRLACCHPNHTGKRNRPENATAH